MLRDNLKTAIGNSGMIVKEVADRSGVRKRTIDKWVGTNATEPKVNDFYKVCKTLGVTVEWVVDGEAGAEYVRQTVKNDPQAIQVPERIHSLVNSLLVLNENELAGIRANAEVLANAKKGNRGTTTEVEDQSKAVG